MNRELFVQNIKLFCDIKGVSQTTACRDAGVGTSFVSDIKRGQTPSVEKVQTLAQYLGVTVSELLGETQPQENLVLRDSAVVLKPSDVKRLTVAEVEMVMEYRRATPEEQQAISLILGKYKEKGANHAG